MKTSNTTKPMHWYLVTFLNCEGTRCREEVLTHSARRAAHCVRLLADETITVLRVERI